MAQGLNEDLQQFCEDSNGRFYGFGVLPTSTIDGCLEELERISKLDKLRGVVLSTHGRGLYVRAPGVCLCCVFCCFGLLVYHGRCANTLAVLSPRMMCV